MRRVLWIGQLDPGHIEEYTKKHREIWPEMVAMIKEAGIRNYSIFVDGVTVVGYYECDDFAKTQRHQEVAPITSEWAKHMDGCFTLTPRIVNNEVMYIS